MRPINLGSRMQLLCAAAMISLLAGCTSTPSTEKTTTEEQTVTATTPGGAATAGTAGGGVTGTKTEGQGNPLHDPRSPLSKRSVYFDYDSYAIKDEFKPLIQAHAKYLQTTHTARITIQGNCDERGSSEYNLALGQRRADAVKRMMEVLGAPDGQIETVSFGKEKPKNPGHDEAAWTENRRDDLVYAGE